MISDEAGCLKKTAGSPLEDVHKKLTESLQKKGAKKHRLWTNQTQHKSDYPGSPSPPLPATYTTYRYCTSYRHVAAHMADLAVAAAFDAAGVHPRPLHPLHVGVRF